MPKPLRYQQRQALASARAWHRAMNFNEEILHDPPVGGPSQRRSTSRLLPCAGQAVLNPLFFNGKGNKIG